MTNQEIFNIASKHLLKQNAKSKMFDSEICAYRGPEGLMCAVGVLIPDDKYEECLEGKTVEKIYQRLGFEYDNLYLLKDLQFIHDRVDVEHWEEQLEITRRNYKLEKA